MCASRPPKTALTSENLLTTQPDTLCHRNFILLIVVPCKAFGVVSPSCLEGYPAPTHVARSLPLRSSYFGSTDPEGNFKATSIYRHVSSGFRLPLSQRIRQKRGCRSNLFS